MIDIEWKDCPPDVSGDRRYIVDRENPRIVLNIKCSQKYCTVIGNAPLPLGTVSTWGIKIRSFNNAYDEYICVGVAPSDIDQDGGDNYEKCGWYFDFYNSMLRSGPPYSYKGKKYGSVKQWEKRAFIESIVGVMIDATKGELSFALNDINYGVAYERIPLDKPLVPCVLLSRNDSIEFEPYEVRDIELDSLYPVPSGIIAKNENTWDTITLTWNVDDGASFYQVEMSGSKFWDALTANTLTKRGLLPDTEYSFRVRSVGGGLASGWSEPVKGKTQKDSFKTGGWKECPDYVDDKRKYSVDGKKNFRVATKIYNGGWSTIIGNTPIPLNTVASWNIKVLKSEKDDGNGICVGVAPFDINQDYNDNYCKYGWYYNCYSSTLCSGPPHNFNESRIYGPRKEKDGEYVYTLDDIGVVMDTINGVLSFVLNWVNIGTAYEGISLDKPLVPCVLLGNKDDSVELDLSDVEVNEVDCTIPVPLKITAKSETSDSISIKWDAAQGVSFYQIEANGKNYGAASTTNAFILDRLDPASVYEIRVRAVVNKKVGEWSEAVKEVTQKASLEQWEWRKCPSNVYSAKKYAVDEKNPRLVTKVGESSSCTITGCSFLPPNAVSSWGIKMQSKILGSCHIYVGVAPSDINQNAEDNYKKCGWYFDCYDTKLWPEPPDHDYTLMNYGPKVKPGRYTSKGCVVGVVMDTEKGELSFVLDKVNHGVAHKCIPLDKPLVPCVILEVKDISVELIARDRKSGKGGKNDKDCIIS